tara:strand:+ start:31676 stop:32974 length:1299 start_codon:yes stop_codon:yes gene_type:complete
MQFLWKYIDDLVGKGLEISQISELLFYASARFVPLALPISMLLSSVMLFGKLAEQYELIALRSAGVSFYKLLLPLVFLAIGMCYASFLFSNYVMPIANLKNASMIYDIQKKKPALNIKEGVFYKDIEGYSIKINKKDSDGSTLHDIIIYDHTAREGNNMVIIAESGKMQVTANEKFLELTLYNGHSYMDIPEKKRKKDDPFRTTHFQEDLIRFDLEKFNTIKNSEKLYKGHYAMLNNKQLKIAIDSLEREHKEKKLLFKKNIHNKYTKEIILKDTYQPPVSYINDKRQQYNIAINKIRTLESIAKSNKNNLEYQNIIITKHKIEWHRKISLAFACLLLFLIGAPLGSIIKQGGFGYPVLIAVLFFIFYYTLNIIGEKSAKELNILAYEGMWLANIVFIPIAIFLNYKAKSNSEIFNTSAFSMIFYRLIKKKN